MGKVYFASDFHLGVGTRSASLEREKRICRWLDRAATDADHIYLCGDLFDFWFEYGKAIPKGYIRFFGKLAELRDNGIAITVFTGNHDMWLFDYFPEELDIPVLRAPIQREIGGKQFFIGHGDGLGPGDVGYKRLKRLFSNRYCQWLFARLHPNFGIGLAEYLSRRSRAATQTEKFLGAEEEWLIAYCDRKLETLEITPDFFVFGHRHIPIDWLLKNGKSRYVNLGDWIHYNSYAVFDGQELQMYFFEKDSQSLLVSNKP
jgi:UDP-2,3-diacylglucosamine hydrolase